MNLNLEKTVIGMTYASLLTLALGLVTSITILAGFHIFMILPIIVFLNKADYKKWQASTWALFSLGIVLILSVVFNQDIAFNGYAPLTKVKYFIFGFLSIAPLAYFFKNHLTDRKIKTLLYVFLVATTFASLVGIFSRYWKFNPVTWRAVVEDRNAGLFGMVMNYAHNMAYFQILITGMIVYKKEVEKYINLNFLYIVFAINLIGLYFTYTRGAWLAFLVGIPFFLFKNYKKWMLGIVLTVAILGGLTYSLAGMQVIRPKSDLQRISQWKAAVAAFKERPILGYGYLNFEHHSVELKQRYNLGELDFEGHAHSNFFEMLGSAGILGVLAYCTWLITWFIEMYRRSDIVASMTLPFIVVFMVGGLTQSTISLGINLFFVIAVYSISACRPLTNTKA